MSEAIAEGRAARRRRRRSGRAPAADRARLHLDAPRPRPRPRGRLSGRAAPVDEVHGALLGDAAARLPRHHPRRHRRRPGAAASSAPTLNPTLAAKMFFGALDEMATNWILSRRRYSLAGRGRRRSSTSSSAGCGTPRARRTRRSAPPPCSAPARWARRSPRTSRTPACRCCCSTSPPTPRATASNARPRAQAGSVLHARRRGARSAPAASTTDLAAARGVRLDRRSHRRTARRQAGAARASRRDPRPARDRQLEHVRHSHRGARRGPLRRLPARTALGTHFFNPPRYLRLLEIIPTPETDPGVVEAMSHVRRSPPRQGRGDREGHAELHRQPHRPASACCRSCARWTAASSRSRRSTRSRVRRSAGRRARPSARSTSPASTSSPTSSGTLPSDCRTTNAGAVRAAAVRRGAGRARLDRREGRSGFLQEGRATARS